MGLFGNKKEKLSQNEMALKQAKGIFKDTLSLDEKILFAISGKCAAKNLIFSVGILGATEKRLIYYFQDGNKTGTETILYSKIVSVTSISGFEKKMGNYIGISIELANGQERTVRCIVRDEIKQMINDMILYIEENR